MAALKSLFLLFLSNLSYTASSNVPIITWDVGHSKPVVSTLAGHTLDVVNSYDEYLHPIIENNEYTFIFLQDELSIDDFVKFAPSFEFVKRFNEIQKPFVLPNVDTKEVYVDSVIRKFSNKSITDVYNEDLKDWVFNKASNIVFFHLEPVRGTTLDGKKAILKQNDQLFHDTLKKVEKTIKDFAVIFTSKESSNNVFQVLSSERLSDSDSMLKRQLLAVETKEETATVTDVEDGKLFNNTGCVIMYLKSLKFGDGRNQTELINNTWKISESACVSQKFYSIHVSTDKKTGDVDKFSMLIELEYDEGSQEWHCGNITLEGSSYKGEELTNASIQCGGMYNKNFVGFPFEQNPGIIVPAAMCFSCGNIKFNISNHILELGSLQLQPKTNGVKGEKLRKFSGAYNCVGFFTIEILTGIFVTIILALGLFMGISMILSIQTPERFDDPKGTTITVTAQE